MSKPRKVAWLKPSCGPFKVLLALGAAGGEMSQRDMTRLLAGLYNTSDTMRAAHAELVRSGLIARVVVLTAAGRAALAARAVPVPVLLPVKAVVEIAASPAPAVPRQCPGGAPTKSSGIGSTGPGHPWRGRKAVPA